MSICPSGPLRDFVVEFVLQARYYGGDVVLKSMEGFGTDVYVFLNRLHWEENEDFFN